MHNSGNTAPNNYITCDERFTICVTGTLIFKNLYGGKALSSLRDELHSGKELADLFGRFRGPYTLIQIDRAVGQVSILNSREGLRNCFVAMRNDLRAYSTNLLLVAALTDAAPCTDGIRQFIHVGAIIGEKTIFDNVTRLSAASLHLYRNETWKGRRLWQIKTSTPDCSITRQNATKTVMESFVRNFDFASNIDSGRVAVDLTGGTDSRTVLCCLMDKHPRPVASTSGGEDYIDVRIARKIAAKLGIEHYWYKPVSAEVTDEQIMRAVEVADGDRDVIGLAYVLPYYEEKARRFHFITGGAGGPLFKDHYWLFEFNRVGLEREPNWNRIANLSLVKYAIKDEFFSAFSDRILDNTAEMLRRHSANVKGTNNQKLDFVYFDLKVPAFGGQDFSLTTQFMDVFHPMLDGDNVQYSINLPPQIRLRSILQFSIVEYLRPELRWLLTDTGLPAIPPIGSYSWLRLLRGRRYMAAAVRKIRTALFGSSGEETDKSCDINRVRSLGYFDLLKHSSLMFSSIISASKLAEFVDSPERQPNQWYVINTLSVQLFFERARELKNKAKRITDERSTVMASGGIRPSIR